MNDFTAQELAIALTQLNRYLNCIDQTSIHQYFKIMQEHTEALNENTKILKIYIMSQEKYNNPQRNC